jgi:type IV secretion system protein VirD4
VDEAAYHLPKEVGDRKTHPLGYVAFGVLLVCASWVATQVFAAALRFDPGLGRPLLFTPRLDPVRAIYVPWDWLTWLWKFANPVNGYNYIWKTPYWPMVVYDKLRIAGIVFGAGCVVAYAGIYVTSWLLRDRRGRVEELVDSSRWATAADLEREGLLGAKAGPIIGGFEVKGDVLPLRYDGELGINYIGPPGDGKSALLKTSLLIPLQHEDAAKWPADERRAKFYGEEPSIITLDVKGNLVESTSAYQRDVLGKDVFVLEPFADETTGLAMFNPLWAIHVGTDREADDCYQASLDIVDVDGKGLPDYWSKASTAFGGAIIAVLGYRALQRNNPTLLSLPSLVDYISSHRAQDDVEAIDVLIADMLQPHDPHHVFGWRDTDGKPTAHREWIVRAALAMRAKASEEKSGVYGSFIECLGIYRSEVLRKHISRSTFSFKDLANRQKPAIVYINVPAMKLDHLRPLLRNITRVAIRELTETTGSIDGREVRGNKRSTILALDEVAALKHVEELSTASGFLRGHGVALWLFWQSASQIARIYGDNESITETIDVHIFGRSKTYKAARTIAESLGKFSAVVTKRNTSGQRLAPGPLGHLSVNADINTRELLTAGEFMRLPRTRNIILAHGLKTNALKFSYFLHPWLVQRARRGRIGPSSCMTEAAPFVVHLEEKMGTEKLKLLRAPVGKAKKVEPLRVTIDHTTDPKAAFVTAGGVTS